MTSTAAMCCAMAHGRAVAGAGCPLDHVRIARLLLRASESSARRSRVWPTLLSVCQASEWARALALLASVQAQGVRHSSQL